MAVPRNIVLLGATGSIGESTLEVIRAHPDRLRLAGVAACSNSEKLAAIAQEFDIPHIGLFDQKACEEAAATKLFENRTLHCGAQGLLELAQLPEADLVELAIVGTTGLQPALAALEAGKDLALASKEILVLGGELVMQTAQTHGGTILPLDSEHNAIFQCLQGERRADLDAIVLTASGGAFREATPEQMANVTLEQALAHPNWSMGPKVTIDSSTMANKGLEVIEARWLFDLAPPQIEVVIHPQSIVHSLVRFVDGSVIAQLSPPSMTFAIQHALLYPNRGHAVRPGLDFTKPLQLDFLPPDFERFPCLHLALESLCTGGTAPAVYNAANEVAVAAFLAKSIGFLDIPRVIDKTLGTIVCPEASDLQSILTVDARAREAAQLIAKELYG